MTICYDSVSKNALSGTELMLKNLESRLSSYDHSQFSIGRAITLFNPQSTKIYWSHNLPGQMTIPEVSEGLAFRPEHRWKKFDQIVFVSDWQRDQYFNHFKFTDEEKARTKVLRNAIVPIPQHIKPPEEIRLIYMSVPSRGLALLVSVFEKLCQKYNIVLDVYSSFKIYGIPNADIEYRHLIEQMHRNRRINYHGTVDNNTIRNAVQFAHIFAYPSIFKETSCLCMIEAMSAGCVCVHPSLAGLPETGAGFTDMYDFVPNRFEHEKVFEQELEKSILKVMSGNYDTSKQKQVTDDTYSWDNRIVEWQNYLDHLKVNNEIFGNRGELQA